MGMAPMPYKLRKKQGPSYERAASLLWQERSHVTRLRGSPSPLLSRASSSPPSLEGRATIPS